jgi:hypothetical protein
VLLSRSYDSLWVLCPWRYDLLWVLWPRSYDSLWVLCPQNYDSLWVLWYRSYDSLWVLCPRRYDSLLVLWPWSSLKRRPFMQGNIPTYRPRVTTLPKSVPNSSYKLPTMIQHILPRTQPQNMTRVTLCMRKCLLICYDLEVMTHGGCYFLLVKCIRIFEIYVQDI